MTVSCSTTATLIKRIQDNLPTGSKVLAVNQQNEPELQQDLEAMFGWKISWYSVGGRNGIRKIESAAAAIRHGSYRLVIGSTGLFAHKYDKMLSMACTTSSVPYVRVNKGRVGVTILAVARSLGLL